VVTDRVEEVWVGILAARTDLNRPDGKIGRRVEPPRNFALITGRDRAEQRKERVVVGAVAPSLGLRHLPRLPSGSMSRGGDPPEASPANHRGRPKGEVHMGAEILERASASTEKVLANVTRDQLTRGTPCASWQVRDVVNHLVGNNFWFEAIARDGVAPDRPDNASPDETSGGYAERFRAGSTNAVAAFDSAMDKTLNLPWGPMPASVFIVMASADQFVHGWDLARATGQPTDLDPELAAQFLDFYRQAIVDEYRGPDRAAPFGMAVTTTSSDPVAQLVAISGRTP